MHIMCILIFYSISLYFFNRYSIRFLYVVYKLHYDSARYFEEVPILAFGYSVLLRIVSASEFLPNSFLSEIRCKVVREVLISTIQSKASNMTVRGFFDFAFKSLEVSEHFAIMPHRVDRGVRGEVVDEAHIISASAECCRLSRSPYVG